MLQHYKDGANVKTTMYTYLPNEFEHIARALRVIGFGGHHFSVSFYFNLEKFNAQIIEIFNIIAVARQCFFATRYNKVLYILLFLYIYIEA